MKQAIQANDFAEGGVYTYKGHRVRILGLDSDPTTLVWIVFLEDEDRDAFVNREELTCP